MNKIEKIKTEISEERLSTYKINDSDTYEDIINRYIYNIQLSEAFYPALALLEVTLRNKIDYAIETLVKPGWILADDIDKFLLKREYNTYFKVKKEKFEETGRIFTIIYILFEVIFFLKRDGKYITNPSPDVVLREKDRLILPGKREQSVNFEKFAVRDKKEICNK